MEKVQKGLLSCPRMPRLLKIEKELLHYYMSKNAEEAFLRQKLRSLWINIQDQNTTYFHEMANVRNAQNSIRCILMEWKYD